MFRHLASILCLACLLPLYAPAGAIVGGARDAATVSNHIVMITGTRGNRAMLCTGTVLSRDVVLTGAHCVAPEGHYQVMPSIGAGALPISAIALHPRYDPREYARGRSVILPTILKTTR